MAARKKTAPRKRRPVYREKHIIGFLFFICFTVTLLLTGVVGVLVALQIPKISSVSAYKPAQATYILDNEGKIIEKVFKENRRVISIADMPALLPKAFVAAEDGRFFSHPGLDAFSVLRALFINIKRQAKAQGGSTITQQVARSLLLTREKTYLRKVKEAILAWRIDTLLSKEDILYIYLNQIYLGSGAYGVEAAAQVYFDKHAKDLTIGEIAILAGLPQAPSRYSPIKNLPLAIKRQRYVLNRMVADGYLTKKQAQDAFNRGVRLARPAKKQTMDVGYYTTIVKKRAQRLVDIPLSVAGATIHTYMNSTLQNRGVMAVRQGVQASFERQVARGNKKAQHPQGALVCLDGCNGRVQALVGGVEYTTSHYNRAVVARRQAGSAFKPIIYALALEQGMQPGSHILDAPLAISAGGGATWRPKNYSGRYHGTVSLTEALAHSYNTAAVRLLKKVGVKSVMNTVETLQIKAKRVEDLSLALGSIDVTLLEISSAYTPFVCGGTYVSPRFVKKIELHGEVIKPPSLEKRQIFSQDTARKMRRMLHVAVTTGTGKRAAGLPGKSGGKTGTTNDLHDAWFVGFHEHRITGVWIGNDNNASLGSGESGGRAAAPVWYAFNRPGIAGKE